MRKIRMKSVIKELRVVTQRGTEKRERATELTHNIITKIRLCISRCNPFILD